MTDTEIIDGLQALVEEYFQLSYSLDFDFQLGAMAVTIRRPAPVHDAKAGIIRSGPPPNLRGHLALGLEPHILRLVTKKLTR